MNRMIFFNIGWMKFYRGLKGDKITGGGENVDRFGEGGEMYNFLPIDAIILNKMDGTAKGGAAISIIINLNYLFYSLV